MTIESVLKNLVEAINANTEAIRKNNYGLKQPGDTPDPIVNTAPAAPPAAVTPAAVTPEELNTILVAEYNRLGDRKPIDAAFKELGATGATDLPVDKYQELINKVKAINV